jgi:chemotaxis protein methyltransferase CheR
LTEPAGVVAADLEAVEVDALLETVYRFYGFDFRQYARPSLRRRLLRRAEFEGVATISALQERLLHDRACMERLLLDLSINVTAMFRDPTFFVAFRQKVVPLLRTYPFIRIWNAGCSTGEETYSLAIVLAEEALLDRTRIYATDINEAVLHKAKEGVFPLDRMQSYTENYQASGGTRAFSEYYTAGYDGARFDRSLIQGAVFSRHNLASDGSFNEFHAIVCRNVMIYFDSQLQDRVHDLFHKSLVRLGVLALGQKESIMFTSHADDYDVVEPVDRIYQRVK